ncbi:MAG: hypothetical protein N3E45_02405 [Oscillatoriaceae bacterium SKW80]|nr:hypothetical protein [Oscillatoriaceae bacterium SKW80]
MGKPLLEYQLEKLQRFKLADEIVIATTNIKQMNLLLSYVTLS